MEVLNINVKGKYLVTVGAANTEEPKLFSETKLEVGVQLTVYSYKGVLMVALVNIFHSLLALTVLSYPLSVCLPVCLNVCLTD